MAERTNDVLAWRAGTYMQQHHNPTVYRPATQPACIRFKRKPLPPPPPPSLLPFLFRKTGKAGETNSHVADLPLDDVLMHPHPPYATLHRPA
ncbi:hypothetical protein LZ32DRAFT_457335 [Colletotrichum eremochloae]|nr:hypothetical protein LZ32DRAFT_457335 [Colletotrichum eremochloae]